MRIVRRMSAKSCQRQRTAARAFTTEQASGARLFAERRSSGMSELRFLQKSGASDIELATMCQWAAEKIPYEILIAA